MNSYDAIVIGAGPAGSTAALLLARAGWSVALLERNSFPRTKVCGEYLSATNLTLLDRLGIGKRFRQMAGTPVRRFGLYAGSTITEAELPRLGSEWGRALGREHLDTWLRDEATAAGARVFQPWAVTQLAEVEGSYRCKTCSRETEATATLEAPIVIAAHGSWDVGQLPTQQPRHQALPDDLLAFKTHFANATLPDGLMPLLAFPGGYGGMVYCDGGRVSLSCCVRRDALARIRRLYHGTAGEAVFQHIQASCLGVRRALDRAVCEQPWLATGPIRPGIRLPGKGGIFPVGNAAGESHPVIAEGISMAMQGSWLLADRLVAWKQNGACRADLPAVQRDYAAAWRKSFAPRLWASCMIAQWSMRPTAVSIVRPLLKVFPALMSCGARFSGKANKVVHSSLG